MKPEEEERRDWESDEEERRDWESDEEERRDWESDEEERREWRGTARVTNETARVTKRKVKNWKYILYKFN